MREEMNDDCVMQDDIVRIRMSKIVVVHQSNESGLCDGKLIFIFNLIK